MLKLREDSSGAHFLGVLAEEKERERIALNGSRKRFFLCRNDQQSGNNENTKPTRFENGED
jgi:hypothetical protein